ncbi:MAG: C45 family peptidase [Candidatus Bathyarchaeota archaeon]|nr:C45 family peptidase [Candidatus Bathyarchaeota archaeon]
MVSPRNQGISRGKTEHTGIKHILGEIERAAGFFNQSLDDFLKVDRNNLKHIPERYVEECDGIAEATGIPEDMILGINFGKGPSSFFREGCTAFAVPKTHSVNGYPMMLKNRDLGYRRIHPQVLAYSRLDGFNQFLGITTAGNAYWYQGINEKGLVVFNTATLCGKFDEGMPTNILIRRILEECDTVDEALQFIDSNKHAVCSNLFMGDHEKMVIAELKNGFPVHVEELEKPDARANHYVFHDNPPLTDQTIILHRQYTLTRYERAKAMLKTVEKVSKDDILGFSRDHANGPGSYSVCRHNAYIGTQLEKLLSSSTLSSQLFVIAEKPETWIALGRPCMTEFVHHKWGEPIPEHLESGKHWIENLKQN